VYYCIEDTMTSTSARAEPIAGCTRVVTEGGAWQLGVVLPVVLPCVRRRAGEPQGPSRSACRSRADQRMWSVRIREVGSRRRGREPLALACARAPRPISITPSPLGGSLA